MTVTDYLLLTAGAIIFGVSFGGLVVLVGRCSEEARSAKLGAGQPSYDRDEATTMAGVDSLTGDPA